MNILHISPYVPDVRTNHAGGVCMGKEVEALRQNGNHVTVLTFVNNELEEKLIKDHPDYEYVKTSRQEYVLKVLSHLNMPNLFALRNSKEFERKMIEIIERDHIDAIHAEYTAMGQFYKIKEKYPHIKFNLVEHDIVLQSYTRLTDTSTGLRKLYYAFQKKLVRKYEEEYCRKADLVFTLNDKDVRLLEQLYGITGARIITPYYGVDFDNISKAEKIPHSLCFVGQMGREENHSAAMRLIRIFKEINRPDYQLTIIGAHPKEELQAQAADNIRITGFVDDINEEILKNEIAVFPLLFGAGIKLKVLLAFGLGLPVITTAVGAEGIDEDGRVLQLAETDEEIRKQITGLLDDPEKLKQTAEASVEYVREHFGWEKTEKLFREIYSD